MSEQPMESAVADELVKKLSVEFVSLYKIVQGLDLCHRVINSGAFAYSDAPYVHGAVDFLKNHHKELVAKIESHEDFPKLQEIQELQKQGGDNDGTS